MPDIDRSAVVASLNRILESELAGAVRYTHYSFMVFGFSRIPIVSWLRTQAAENMVHAHLAGEQITQLGEHPSLAIGPLLETHKHDIHDLLKEVMESERQGLALYHDLHDRVAGRSIALEEYAREMIYKEEMHIGEVDKMLRRPGSHGVSGV